MPGQWSDYQGGGRGSDRWNARRAARGRTGGGGGGIRQPGVHAQRQATRRDNRAVVPPQRGGGGNTLSAQQGGGPTLSAQANVPRDRPFPGGGGFMPPQQGGPMGGKVGGKQGGGGMPMGVQPNRSQFGSPFMGGMGGAQRPNYAQHLQGQGFAF